MAHTHIIYGHIQNTTPNTTNTLILPPNFNSQYEMAEEAFYNYEINYPMNFTTILAKIASNFFWIILNLAFTMIITSYLIHGTQPQETLSQIWLALCNFPVYREDGGRNPIDVDAHNNDSDSDSVEEPEEELEDVFEDDDEPRILTPDHVQQVKYHEPNYLSRPGNLGKVPEVGDLIIFDQRDISIEEEDKLIEKYSHFSSVARCISTYGETPIAPCPGYTCEETGEYSNGDIYVVTSISSQIPNCKASVHRKLHGEPDADITRYTHLFVEPLGESDENPSSISRAIFWYINFEALAICQHESGTVTEFIDNLRIIGHDDRFSRSVSPSPESVEFGNDTCSQLDEDSEGYDIIGHDIEGNNANDYDEPDEDNEGDADIYEQHMLDKAEAILDITEEAVVKLIRLYGAKKNMDEPDKDNSLGKSLEALYQGEADSYNSVDNSKVIKLWGEQLKYYGGDPNFNDGDY